MPLTPFITDLLQTGHVTVEPELQPFSQEDRAEVGRLMAQYHDWDAYHMPLKAPEYDAFAVVWAAEYLYRAIQFLLMRNLGEEEIKANLRPFPHPMTPEAAYSADLILRNLPLVFDLAKSLSPSDPLVVQLLAAAREWPFSAIGIAVEHANPVPAHPSLELAYADRVIAARDRKLAANPIWNRHIQVALGAHSRQFWPEFEPLQEHNL